MKKAVKKLVLNRSTLRRLAALTPGEVKRAFGGYAACTYDVSSCDVGTLYTCQGQGTSCDGCP